MKKSTKLDEKTSAKADSIDWRLVGNIIDHIIHLLDFVDFIRFSATCKFWEKESKLHKTVCSSCPKAHSPWLLLTDQFNHIRQYDTITSLCLYDMNSTHRFEIPIKHKVFAVVGCSNGFIIAVDHNFNIYIFNPISGTHYHLFDYHVSSLLDEYYNECGLFDIVKISVSPISSKVEWVVLTIGPRIMCGNVENNYWTEMKIYPNYNYDMDRDDEEYYDMHYEPEYDETIVDVAFYKGKLYVVKYSGSYVFDLNYQFKDCEPARLGGHVKSREGYYLVESSNYDDLFLVVQMKRSKPGGFKVYKLDMTRGQWDALHVLENFALFVGPNSLIYNSIIVADNNICFMKEKEKGKIGVMGISNSSVDWLKFDGICVEECRALWFTPSFA